MHNAPRPKRKLVALVILAASALLLTACTSTTATSSTKSAAATTSAADLSYAASRVSSYSTLPKTEPAGTAFDASVDRADRLLGSFISFTGIRQHCCTVLLSICQYSAGKVAPPVGV